ncbi:helix-turn-helix domain-containing protein [Bacillus subtilis]|uniref:helix-turn-helix domain-containing protein n=1 Tax=Pseudochrobactrum asaccharolyticum TaxID=354351 RepID=UPI001F1AA566|nr:helix-turn-helix domain-containing protein [Pseudochrobactrum asaccharolyticum]MCF7646651.1 helix-turn-helix domain-containing protein [Pseudochrobactrum asaccharolyticum]MCF7672790.1 helix-turn-helix domain-containing protein [Bacillus subtilis]
MDKTETNSTLSLTSGDEFQMGESPLAEADNQLLSLSYLVLLICQTGSAEFDVNFRRYQMQKDDFLVLYDDSIAMVRNRSADFSCSYYLIDRSMAADIAYGLPNELFLFLSRHPFFTADSNTISFLPLWEQMTAHLQEQMLQYQRTILVNQFQNLFLWLSHKTAGFDIAEKNDYSRQEALCWKFWELIFLHCRQQRDVAFYAGLLNVTPYYLSQLTRRFFNDAPKTLIDRQVILEIKKQLLQPKRSMQQIADDLQFTDASYLSKYFKRHTGIGLTDYRKIIS